MDRHQLEVRRLIKRLGLRLESADQSGGHIKCVIRKDDVIHKVIFPVSPSDNRWRKNMLSYLKKTFQL